MAKTCDSSPVIGASAAKEAAFLMLLQPEATAAVTIGEYSPFASERLIPNYAALVIQGQGVQAGDLGVPERMLMAQASTLDAIFNHLAALAAKADMLPKLDTYMRLALRAQNQARATLETLATIKNPAVVFAKQANIAAGPQQVNNAVAGPSRAREIESEQSKLLEVNDGERLEPQAAGTAGATHQDLEAVAAVDRPKVSGRQGSR